MGIDAFAELVELDVIEPELECESDLNEDEDGTRLTSTSSLKGPDKSL